MKKLNNKGFSLVELIIVIAIMAILVGVVGTQVIPYLEKSRQGKDQQVFSAWNTAAMSAYSMCADKVDASKAHYIKITDTAVGGYDEGNVAVSALTTTFCDLTSLTESGTNMIASRMVSKDGKAVKGVKITIPKDASSQIITRMYTNADCADANESTAFEPIENK